jgi:hypothetical protein
MTSAQADLLIEGTQLLIDVGGRLVELLTLVVFVQVAFFGWTIGRRFSFGKKMTG